MNELVMAGAGLALFVAMLVVLIPILGGWK